MGRALIFSFLAFVFIAQYSPAQIPQTMSYQGLLTNASGTSVPDGNYNLTFRLYTTGIGGAAMRIRA